VSPELGVGLNEPDPHVVLAFGVGATTNPVGKASVNEMPVKAVVEFGFIIVKVRVATPPVQMVEALNDLLIVGWPITVIIAVLLVAPGPLSVELITPVVFMHTQAVVPVTVTLNMQVPPAASVPPLNEIMLGEVVVTVPPQMEALPVGTVIPAGKVSVNDTPVSGSAAFGLVRVKLSEVICPTWIDDAVNDFIIVGAEATVRSAMAVLPVPPLAELTLLVTLCLTPDVVPVTVTLKVQLPLWATVALLRLMLPVVVVRVPPHCDVVAGVVTTTPVGRVSVNATPVRSPAAVVLGLVIVKLRVDIPPLAIVDGVNILDIEGGATTVMVAVLLVLPVPPWLELMVPVVLLCKPAVAPVTGTLNVQVVGLAPCATDPPLNVILPVEFTVVSVPPQVVVGPESATVSPAGSVSVKAMPVRSPPAKLFGLVIVKLRFTNPPSATVEEANDFWIVGGPTTVRVAVLLATPVPPSVDWGALVALVFIPAEVLVIFTVRVQDVPGARVPPPKFNVVSPGVAFQVPVQVEPMPAGFATCNPPVMLSEKFTPVSVTDALGLVSVRVSVVAPLTGIVVGLNDFITVGGCTTVRVALSVATATPQASVGSTV
jgi:hypothetical protein